MLTVTTTTTIAAAAGLVEALERAIGVMEDVELSDLVEELEDLIALRIEAHRRNQPDAESLSLARKMLLAE